MYWGDVFTSPLFFINFPAYKNYTLTNTKKLLKSTILFRSFLYKLDISP